MTVNPSGGNARPGGRSRTAAAQCWRRPRAALSGAINQARIGTIRGVGDRQGPNFDSWLTVSHRSRLTLRVAPIDAREQAKERHGQRLRQELSIISGKRTGAFGFCIIGQINSADVYSSNALFAKLWRTMLEASAIEAIAELKAEEKSQPVDAERHKGFSARISDRQGRSEKCDGANELGQMRNRKEPVFRDSQTSRNGKWVHRNYITK